MKRESRTVDRSDQVDSLTPRHLPLVDLLVDTRAELMELAIASGLRVLETMLEEDRTAHVTSRPDTPAPQMFCPTCDRPLVYRQTVLGGVKPLARWDYFECRTCGHFVYRDRTRKLRHP
jgi:hypothetical protein